MYSRIVKVIRKTNEPQPSLWVMTIKVAQRKLTQGKCATANLECRNPLLLIHCEVAGD